MDISGNSERSYSAIDGGGGQGAVRKSIRIIVYFLTFITNRTAAVESCIILCKDK